MATIVFNTTLQPRNGKRERKTVSTAAVKLTSTAYTVQQAAAANKYNVPDILPKGAIITVETNSIRWTIDGTAPVATTGPGHLAAANDVIYLDSFQKIKEFQAIREGAADAALEVTYLYGN